MDSCRVESYLRSACSVLDFEIGEFWCVRNVPVFEDFRQLLVRPDNTTDPLHDANKCDEEKHRFSPVICRGVSDGGKIVWANTCTTKGLVGRSDLALNTAVGVPMCSIGNDLYVLILFSLETIRMSQHAMEFLCSSARIVSEPSCCFLPASISTIVTPAKVEHFVGLWDMVELMDAYCDDVAFEALSLGRLQNFFDNQESASLKCIFNDFKQIQNTGFTTKQLESLRKFNESTTTSNIMMENGVARERANSASSLESSTSRNWTLSLKNYIADQSGENESEKSMLASLKDEYRSVSGAFTVAFDNTSGTATTEEMRDTESVSSSLLSGRKPVDCFSDYDTMSDRFVSVPIIDVRQSYKKNHSRFHEFMVALMGMTIFDAAELWLFSDISKDLCLVAALHRNGVMGMWTEQSRSMRLNRSVDIPGHVLESGHPYWDQYYDQHDPYDKSHPRAVLASALHVRTAFAIPLPGADGVGGVLALYSSLRVDVDLVLVSYVAKALQLLSASSIDSEILAQMDIESVIGTPRHQLEKWHVEVPSGRDQCSTRDGANTASVTTLHSASKVNGAITLTIVSEAQTAEGSSGSAANTVFTISPMGSLANPNSELATLHAQHMRSGRSTSPGRGKVRRIGDRDLNDPIGSYDNSGGSRVLYGCRMETYRPQGNVKAAKQQLRQQSIQFQNKVVNDPMFQFHPVVLNGYNEFQKLQHQYGDKYSAGASACVMDMDPIKYKSVQFSDSKFAHDPSRMITSSYPMELYPGLSVNASGMYGASAMVEELGTPCSTEAESLDYSETGQSRLSTGSSTNSKKGKRRFENTDESNSRLNTLAALSTLFEVNEGVPLGMCKVVGCSEAATTKLANLCAMHASSRRCAANDCNKCAQGGTGFCIAHGGGRRCTFPGCDKGARDKFFCAGHGGGKRCKIENCKKSAVGGSDLCTAHGGGKRCQFEGCTSSAQSKSMLCVKHGGGRRCHISGCTKVARGKTNFCAAHRNGIIAGQSAMEWTNDSMESCLPCGPSGTITAAVIGEEA